MRYQQGSIEEVRTAQGPCWYIRFTVDGKRPRFRIGLKSQLKTKSAASRAAKSIRDSVNNGEPVNSDELAQPRTFGDVVARYENEEMPERYSTRRGYMNIHRVHIMPRWGSTPLEEMNPMAVRQWLKELDRSTRTRGHILGQMRQLFRFSMLWGWMAGAVNPMSFFTIAGSTKRTRKPRVIGPEQFQTLIAAEKDIRLVTMYIGAYCLGLRASELFGLQWGDFDFLAEKVWIRRAVVDSRTGDVKTERSNAALPLGEAGKYFLEYYASLNTFKGEGDWVFASQQQAGKFPLTSKWFQQTYLIPAGKTLGLDFNLGWHTFRHSYKVLLERSGADLTVQRDLMRHADTHTTSQIYGEVEFDRMKSAHEKAMALAFGKGHIE